MDNLYNTEGYGLNWGPTDDPNEVKRRWQWDSAISCFMDMGEKFSRSRKGKGKEYFDTLAWYFMNEMYEMNLQIGDLFLGTAADDTGWIRSSKIEHDLAKDIPHRTSLYRLLADMVEAEMLQKKVEIEKGPRSASSKKKGNVYYRMLLHEPTEAHFQLMTRDELLQETVKWYRAFKKYGELYLGAREGLKSTGIKDENIDDYLLEFFAPQREEDKGLYQINLNMALEWLADIKK